METDVVTIEPIAKMEHLDKIAEMYFEDEPISKALNIQRSDWVALSRATLGECVNNGHSFIATVGNGETKRIVGGITCVQICKESMNAEIALPETMMTIMMSMDDLCKKADAVMALENIQPPKFSIVNASVDKEYRNRGIFYKLLNAVSDSFPPKTPICIQTSSLYSYLGCLKFGGRVLVKCDYKTWEVEGKKPFLNVEEPHDATRYILFA